MTRGDDDDDDQPVDEVALAAARRRLDATTAKDGLLRGLELARRTLAMSPAAPQLSEITLRFRNPPLPVKLIAVRLASESFVASL